MPAFFRPARGRHGHAREIERVLGARSEALYVAEDGERRLAGFLHLILYDTPPIPTIVAKRRAYVENLVIAVPARRKGLGRRLFEEASVWARRRGAEEVLLTVWAGNAVAERFYAALGFSPVNQVLRRAL